MKRIVRALAIALALAAPRPSLAAEVIRVGTLAPAQSPWGHVYRIWDAAVKKRSEGRLELQFYYNASQGDEAAMVVKMKSGQLDAAALTAVGLGKIYQPILALQIPGLFRTWEALDRARAAVAPELEKGLADAGFTLGGWGDVGQVHGMSKGFAIHVPEDLRGKKPFTWRDDVMGPIFYQLVGGITPVPLSIPEVLPSLNVGAVDMVSAPALAAEQLQWASRLDHISEEATIMAIGAMVLSTKRLEALPEDLREILKETGKVASSALRARIRAEDDAAFARLKGRMTVVSLTEAERGKWAAVFKQLAQRLGQGTFSPEFIKRLWALSQASAP
jgi:TRAP-type C4-dicarboxylate transport system substrate-binding protein